MADVQADLTLLGFFGPFMEEIKVTMKPRL